VLTVTEFVLRRSLETAQARLPGLHPENKQKMTDTPTAERILNALSDISLTIIKNAAGEDILRRLTPLSGVQEDILQRLGLGPLSTGSLKFRQLKPDGANGEGHQATYSLSFRRLLLAGDVGLGEASSTRTGQFIMNLGLTRSSSA